MKIKSLLVGMLACTALVGCTDDALDNGGNETQKAVKMDTYISLSVNSNIDSSRSVGKGYGDEDGNVESSGHNAAAQRTENIVNSMLVIVTPENLTTEVNPTVSDAPTINGFVKYLTTVDFTQSADKKTVNMNTPERVDYIQTYKVMVVLNPVSALLTNLGYDATNKTFTKNHRDAYNEVCQFSGAGYENIAGSGEDVNYSFMMANQSEETVTPTEANQVETNPAKATIEVERAVSKVTFRPVLGDNDDSGEDDNKYDIAVTIKEYKANFARKWYMEEYTTTIDEKEVKVYKYTYAIFNEATYNDENVWVLLKEAKQYAGGQVDPSDIVGIFQEQTEDGKTVEYTGYVKIEANEELGEEAFEGNKTAALLKDITPTGTEYLNELKFVVTEVISENQDSENYTIRLEKYALTNMSNKVYAVRHNNRGSNPCGVLVGTDYIVDPYTSSKVVSENAAYSTWFEENTVFSTIVSQAKQYEISNWNDLPTSIGYVSENEDVDSAHGDVTDAGHLLRYCYENSVLLENVNDNLISGVVFVGQIMDGTTAVPVLYKYKGHFYRTLKDLLMKNAELNISENSSDDAIEKANIEIYKEGKCYYYAGIKHLDNGTSDYDYTDENVKTYDVTKGGVGNMEFAIMRNNIYSLAIKGISGIGMSTLELQAGTGIADQSAFITVECEIMPWIVRFNEIEF